MAINRRRKRGNDIGLEPIAGGLAKWAARYQSDQPDPPPSSKDKARERQRIEGNHQLWIKCEEQKDLARQDRKAWFGKGGKGEIERHLARRRREGYVSSQR